MTPRLVLSGWLALTAVAGCDNTVASWHATTARIDGVELGRGYDGSRALGVGSTFTPADTALHAVVGVSAIPPDTKFIGSWIAVDAGGVTNQLIDKSEFIAASGTTQLHFTLSNDKPWPPGRYRFDVQIDGEPARAQEFVVAGSVGAPPPATEVALVPPAAVASAPADASAATPMPVAAPAPTVAAESDAEPEPDAAIAGAPAPASAKRYPASVAGICSKMVDCGCEQSVSACSETLAGIAKLPASVKKCALAKSCSGLCGTEAQKCVTDHYAAEAEMSRQIAEMGRRQRESWPTGDGGGCRSGYHRVGNTCYAD